MDPLSAPELGAVVGYYLAWYAKPGDDTSKELERGLLTDVADRLHLTPLGEVVNTKRYLYPPLAIGNGPRMSIPQIVKCHVSRMVRTG